MVLFGVILACQSSDVEKVDATNIDRSLPVPYFNVLPMNPTTEDEIQFILSDVLLPQDDGIVYTRVLWENGPLLWEGQTLPKEITTSGDVWTISVWFESIYGLSEVVEKEISVASIFNQDHIELNTVPSYPSSTDDIEAQVMLDNFEGVLSGFDYLWTRNNSAIDNNSPNLSQELTTKGDVWQLVVRIESSQGIYQSVAHEFEVGNSAPILSGIAIMMTTTDDGPEASIGEIVNEPDNDPLTREYRWFLNGYQLIAETNAVLQTASFSRGDEIEAEMRVFDGEDYSAWRRSAPVTLENIAPEIESVNISPEEPMSYQMLSCGYDGYVDLDGDPDQSLIEWFRGGQRVGEGGYLNLRNINVNPGEEIYCFVTPSDGLDDGETKITSVLIQNSAPITFDVELTPTVAYETSSLTCSPTNTIDLDGTVVFTYQYVWYSSGGELSLNGNHMSLSRCTESCLNYQRGSVVMCGVIADDGSVVGNRTGNLAFSNAVRIQNTIPIATGINITPQQILSDSILYCSINDFFDPDYNDVNESIFIWKVNGQFVKFGQDFPLALYPTTNLDSFTCEVTLFDGSDFGMTYTETVGYINGAPEITSLSIYPESAYSIDDIQVIAAASDPENDLVVLDYNWLVNGMPAVGGSNILSGPFSPGDVIQVQVTPFDGQIYGNAVVSAPITILNSPPTQPEVNIFPNNYGISCEILTPSIDIDGDFIVSMVNWVCDGVDLDYPTSPSDSVLQAGFLTSTYPYDTVPNSLLSSCTLWGCRVTPSDGVENGAAGVSSVYIHTP